MSGLGFFDAAPVSSSDDEEPSAAPEPEPSAAPEPAPAPSNEPEPAPPPAPVPDGPAAKRVRLLSPEAAAALVAGGPASYAAALPADDGDGGFYSGSAAQAQPAVAHIGTAQSRTVELSGDAVAALLAGGGPVRSLEAATGCRVVVERAGNEHDLGPRKVTLVGDSHALRLGEQKLLELAAAATQFQSRVIRCTPDQAGALIGRGGVVVKRLQAATGTHIVVSGREAGETRTVSIRGSEYNVEQAARFVYAGLRSPGELAELLAEAEAAAQTGGRGGLAASYGDAAQYGR